MTEHDKYIFSSVLVAVVVSGASGVLLPPNSPLTIIVTWVVTIYAAIAIVYFLVRLGIERYTGGRYAVEAFLLDSANRLLVYRHPHHKKMLPPGGRLESGEFPTDGLEKRLDERLKLKRGEYKYVDLTLAFLIPREAFANVQSLPTPFRVQKEVIRQRRFKRFHYDFIYVLMLTSDRSSFDASKYDPVQFVDLQQLEQMGNRGETYADVVDTYRQILYLIEHEPRLLQQALRS